MIALLLSLLVLIIIMAQALTGRAYTKNCKARYELMIKRLCVNPVEVKQDLATKLMLLTGLKHTLTGPFIHQRNGNGLGDLIPIPEARAFVIRLRYTSI